MFCSPAPEVKNATWPASEDYLVPVNTLVSYTCDEHHEFSNGESRKSIVCLGSGQWNKDPGHCDCKYLKGKRSSIGKSLVCLGNGYQVYCVFGKWLL